jgi:hypothetical protein
MVQASFKKKLELSRESQLFEGRGEERLLLVSSVCLRSINYLQKTTDNSVQAMAKTLLALGGMYSGGHKSEDINC